MMVATTALVPAVVANGASRSKDLLVARGPGADETFTIDSLTTCHVFDGLTIMVNTGATAIRIVGVSAIIPSEASPATDQISYQLRSFRRGTTTGAVGAVESMPVLGGHVQGDAVGGELRPLASSSLWYDVVIRMQVRQPRATEWVIRGVRIEYRVGGRFFTTSFPQQVRLPHTDC
jgi:hypothetical protein